MNEENGREIRDIMITLSAHDSKMTELYHRIKAQEQQSKALSDMSLNVKELAVTMKGMLSEQKSQGERITKLERAPLARYEKLIFSVFSALLGFLSALAVALAL